MNPPIEQNAHHLSFDDLVWVCCCGREFDQTDAAFARLAAHTREVPEVLVLIDESDADARLALARLQHALATRVGGEGLAIIPADR